MGVIFEESNEIVETERIEELTISVDPDLEELINVEEGIHVTVGAMINEEEIEPVDFTIGTSEPIPVPPATTENSIFRLGKTDDENDTILGFSEAILKEPEKLRSYNSLDFSKFSKENGIKYVNGDCKFNVDTEVLDKGGKPKKVFDI
jgi:hypothetical protein